MPTAVAPPTAHTSRHQASDVVVGLVLISSGVVATLCIAPRAGFGTIYPWASYVFCAALAIAGVIIAMGLRSEFRPWSAPAAAVALVSAMQLGGMGVVAIKHWEPAFGMGGGYGSLDQLEQRAWIVAAIGTVAGLAALLAMRRVYTRAEPRRVRMTCGISGALFVFLLPVAVGAGSAENLDATSLGAFALMYGLPWGIALIIAGWLRRSTALWAIGAVTMSAGFCVARARMVDLIFWDATVTFVAALIVAGLVFAVRLRAR